LKGRKVDKKEDMMKKGKQRRIIMSKENGIESWQTTVIEKMLAGSGNPPK